MSANVKFSEVITYFEQLAAMHVDIGHTLNQKHFVRFEIDELASGLPTSIYFPVLVLEGCSSSLSDVQDNTFKNRLSGFFILDKVSDPGNYTAIQQIFDKTEEIGDEIIRRMRHDKRKPGSPMRNFKFGSVETEMHSFSSGYLFGMRYSFAMESSFNADIDIEKWTDTNPTSSP